MILRGFFKIMHSLFVDTTNQLTFGLLTEKWGWRDYFHSPELRTSAVKIHALIFEMLRKHGLSMSDIGKVFFLNGPGSYTGVRVSEGMAQVFKWLSLETYSFYHQDIPLLLNYEKGSFYVNAFKGEVFSFEWSEESKKSNLCAISNLKGNINSSEGALNFFIEPSELEKELSLKDGLYTTKLLKEKPEVLFPSVLEKELRKPPFYFRPLEKEFKPSY
ncbi:MAG: hypothetical protein CME68_00200 [Halobacteriovoraceae bacterium]|nr:hypothetical protein [Halobacteriovoraceae bacterium]